MKTKETPSLKLTIRGKHCRIVAENPDAKFTQHFHERMSEAIQEEIHDFLQEVAVALRKCEPGQTVELSSRPMKVTITKPPEPTGLIVPSSSTEVVTVE